MKSSNMNVDNLTNNGPDATSNPKTDGKNKVSDCVDAILSLPKLPVSPGSSKPNSNYLGPNLYRGEHQRAHLRRAVPLELFCGQMQLSLKGGLDLVKTYIAYGLTSQIKFSKALQQVARSEATGEKWPETQQYFLKLLDVMIKYKDQSGQQFHLLKSLSTASRTKVIMNMDNCHSPAKTTGTKDGQNLIPSEYRFASFDQILPPNNI